MPTEPNSLDFKFNDKGFGQGLQLLFLFFAYLTFFGANLDIFA
jgi:hypothetical protein